MRTLMITVLTATWMLAARAQDTNALKTEIENFEAQTNTILVRAYGPAGTVSVSSETVEVFCKESSDVTHGVKMYGAALEVVESQPREAAVVDEDELASLVNALDYLAKVNNDVTKLPAFNANYTTKCGLRFAAHSARKQGGMDYYFQMNDGPRIPLTNVQVSQIADLLEQAQKTINGLKQQK